MVLGKDEQGCFSGLYALLSHSPSSNTFLLCTPPSLSQVTSVPLCVLLLHLHGAWFKLPHATVVVCEPTFVLLECLPVKVSLRLRHLSTKSNGPCSVLSGQFRTLPNV